MNNIKIQRERTGMSQAEVAKRLHISQQAIAKWETGEASPQAQKLPQLAALFGCTIDELFDVG